MFTKEAGDMQSSKSSFAQKLGFKTFCPRWMQDDAGKPLAVTSRHSPSLTVTRLLYEDKQRFTTIQCRQRQGIDECLSHSAPLLFPRDHTFTEPQLLTFGIRLGSTCDCNHKLCRPKTKGF